MDKGNIWILCNWKYRNKRIISFKTSKRNTFDCIKLHYNVPQCITTHGLRLFNTFCPPPPGSSGIGRNLTKVLWRCGDKVKELEEEKTNSYLPNNYSLHSSCCKCCPVLLSIFSRHKDPVSWAQTAWRPNALQNPPTSWSRFRSR